MSHRITARSNHRIFRPLGLVDKRGKSTWFGRIWVPTSKRFLATKLGQAAKQVVSFLHPRSQKNASHPILTWVARTQEVLKRKKNGMGLSSAAARLQPMHARRPTPFSRATSQDHRFRPRARRSARNSRPAARTRAVKRAHVRSERPRSTHGMHPIYDTV